MLHIELNVKIGITYKNLSEVKESLKILNEIGALKESDRYNSSATIMSIIERLQSQKFVLDKNKLTLRVSDSISKYYKNNKNSRDPKVTRLIECFEVDNCASSYRDRIARETVDLLSYNLDSVDELILNLKMVDILAGYCLYDLIISAYPSTGFSDFLFKFH